MPAVTVMRLIPYKFKPYSKDVVDVGVVPSSGIHIGALVLAIQVVLAHTRIRSLLPLEKLPHYHFPYHRIGSFTVGVVGLGSSVAARATGIVATHHADVYAKPSVKTYW